MLSLASHLLERAFISGLGHQWVVFCAVSVLGGAQQSFLDFTEMFYFIAGFLLKNPTLPQTRCKWQLQEVNGVLVPASLCLYATVDNSEFDLK